MNQLDRLERDLTAWFAETAAPRTPPYLEDILHQTARIRQRPSWAFVERLLPMTATTSFRAVTGSPPWRILGVLAVLLLALLLGALLVGSTQPRLPAPFGPAAAGLVAYSSDGDIFLVDPATSQRHSIVTGPENDFNPQWSRDGTKLVFERRDGGQSQLFTIRPDGSGLAGITPDPITIMDDPGGANYTFSPDGRSVLFLSASRMFIAQSDGSGVVALETPGISLVEAAWRPPDGAQIGALGGDGDLYLVDVASGTVQTLVPPDTDLDAGGILWSPDGSQLSYNPWSVSAAVFTVRAHILDVEDGANRLAEPPAVDLSWDALATWSNDGQRLALIRNEADGYGDLEAVILRADGSGSAVETAVRLPQVQECCVAIEWAPDDSTILLTPVDSNTAQQPQLLLDPDTGLVTPAPWRAISDPAWQRLAP